MIRYADKFARVTNDQDPPLSTLARSLPSPPLEIERVAGGFSNINARVILQDHSRALLRYRPGATTSLTTELAIMARVSNTVPTPRLIARGEDWALLEWLDGERVDALFEENELAGAWPEIARACGEQLANVHRYACDKAGFFAPDLSIEELLPGAGTGILQYLDESTARDLVLARLTPRRAARVRAVIEAWRDLFTLMDDEVTLVHSDFNTKNLLAMNDPERGWHVSAVLDWEFGFAGSRWMDLGNFLRFEHEVPASVSDAFVDGYATGCEAPLPGDWRTRARLLDLGSMISFLNRDALSTRTLETVLGVIDRSSALLLDEAR